MAFFDLVDRINGTVTIPYVSEANKCAQKLTKQVAPPCGVNGVNLLWMAQFDSNSTVVGLLVRFDDIRQSACHISSH